MSSRGAQDTFAANAKRRSTKAPNPAAFVAECGEALQSVPAVRTLEAPGGTWAAVTVLHVLDAPDDLGGGVGPPITTLARHLRAGQRLRDPVRPGARVGGVHPPHALPHDDVIEAVELVLAVPKLVLQDLPSDLLRIGHAGLVATVSQRPLPVSFLFVRPLGSGR